jgi:hypothetical protein
MSKPAFPVEQIDIGQMIEYVERALAIANEEMARQAEVNS